MNTWWDSTCAGEAWGARGAGPGGPWVGLAGEGMESRCQGGKVGDAWVLEGPSLGEGGQGREEAMSPDFLPDSESSRYQNFSKGGWDPGRWAAVGPRAQCSGLILASSCREQTRIQIRIRCSLHVSGFRQGRHLLPAPIHPCRASPFMKASGPRTHWPRQVLSSITSPQLAMALWGQDVALL